MTATASRQKMPPKSFPSQECRSWSSTLSSQPSKQQQYIYPIAENAPVKSSQVVDQVSQVSQVSRNRGASCILTAVLRPCGGCATASPCCLLVRSYSYSYGLMGLSKSIYCTSYEYNFQQWGNARSSVKGLSSNNLFPILKLHFHHSHAIQ